MENEELFGKKVTEILSVLRVIVVSNPTSEFIGGFILSLVLILLKLLI